MLTRTDRTRLLRSDRDEIALDELDVVGLCSRCYPGERLGDVDVRLVSPRGVAHESSGYGRTDCGYDATGPGWWWAL